MVLGASDGTASAVISDRVGFAFGKGGGTALANKEDVPLLAEITSVQSIRESCDEGSPVTMKDNEITDIYIELSQSVARQVAIRNASKEPTEVVEIAQQYIL